MFAAWGRLVVRWRWAMLAVSGIVLVASVVGLLSGGTLRSGNSGTSSLEAARAQVLVNQQLGGGKTISASFLLIFTSQDRQVGDPAVRTAVESALAPIR